MTSNNQNSNKFTLFKVTLYNDKGYVNIRQFFLINLHNLFQNLFFNIIKKKKYMDGLIKLKS